MSQIIDSLKARYSKLKTFTNNHLPFKCSRPKSLTKNKSTTLDPNPSSHQYMTAQLGWRDISDEYMVTLSSYSWIFENNSNISAKPKFIIFLPWSQLVTWVQIPVWRSIYLFAASESHWNRWLLGKLYAVDKKNHYGVIEMQDGNQTLFFINILVFI